MEKSELASPAYEKNLGEGEFVGGIFFNHIWRCSKCSLILRRRNEPDPYYDGGCPIKGIAEDAPYQHFWRDEGISRE